MEPTLSRVSVSPRVSRHLFASLAALVLTAALLLLMTRLILPPDNDRVVAETRYPLELQRVPLLLEDDVLRRREEPEEPDRDTILEIVISEARRPNALLFAGTVVDIDKEPPATEPVRDLEATVKTVIENMEARKYRDWLATRGGSRKYVSIMQGPMPASSGAEPYSPRVSSTGQSYRNTYGEAEVALNDNCVMQLRSTAFDYSDFSSKLPARISCRPTPPKIDLAGLERHVQPLAVPSRDEAAVPGDE